MAGNNMGIHKEIDKLGRLVVPKEMRDLFRLDDEGVELIVTEEGILLRNPQYKLVKRDDKKEKNK